MKCPLLCISNPLEMARKGLTEVDCLETDCAWWSEDEKRCDPTGLLPYLKDLVLRLSHPAIFRVGKPKGGEE